MRWVIIILMAGLLGCTSHPGVNLEEQKIYIPYEKVEKYLDQLAEGKISIKQFQGYIEDLRHTEIMKQLKEGAK